MSGEPGALMSGGRKRCASQHKKRGNLPFLLHSVVLNHSQLNHPQRIGKGGSLHWVYHIKCYSAPETPSQIHPEIMTEQFCEPLLGQSSGHTKLSIRVINSTNYSCSWILHLSTKNISSGQGLLHLLNGVLPMHQALLNFQKKSVE